MIEWDFEGGVTFLTPEEGGLAHLPRMGYWPSFRYPEFDDGTQFVARPVMGFRGTGRPYDDGERLDANVVFRFRFLRRDWYESIHRGRLVRGRRFELMEGSRTTARGFVLRTHDDILPIEDGIERLVFDLGDAVPADDAKEVLAFLYHTEWECAVDLLWYAIGRHGVTIGRDEHTRLLDLGSRCGFDFERAERECPLRVREDLI